MSDEQSDAQAAVDAAEAAETDAEQVQTDVENELPTCPTIVSGSATIPLTMSDGSTVNVSVTIAPAS